MLSLLIRRFSLAGCCHYFRAIFAFDLCYSLSMPSLRHSLFISPLSLSLRYAISSIDFILFIIERCGRRVRSRRDAPLITFITMPLMLRHWCHADMPLLFSPLLISLSSPFSPAFLFSIIYVTLLFILHYCHWCFRYFSRCWYFFLVHLLIGCFISFSATFYFAVTLVIFWLIAKYFSSLRYFDAVLIGFRFSPYLAPCRFLMAMPRRMLSFISFRWLIIYFIDYFADWYASFIFDADAFIYFGTLLMLLSLTLLLQLAISRLILMLLLILLMMACLMLLLTYYCCSCWCCLHADAALLRRYAAAFAADISDLFSLSMLSDIIDSFSSMLLIFFFWWIIFDCHYFHASSLFIIGFHIIIDISLLATAAIDFLWFHFADASHLLIIWYFFFAFTFRHFRCFSFDTLMLMLLMLSSCWLITLIISLHFISSLPIDIFSSFLSSLHFLLFIDYA